MSIDFDSAALQTQHDEEEYDQEDYAREQEVQHTVTVLLRLSRHLSSCWIWFCHLPVILLNVL